MKLRRADRINFSSPEITREGYIKGFPVVTRTGVFKYLNADGSIRRELRHPDDVMQDSSLSSLQGIPITLNHPPVLVDSANAPIYQKGMTGDHYDAEGQNVRVNVTITHQDAVNAIKGGMNQLSLGYELDLVEESGVYNGEEYDYRQVNIDYNHLAIVDVARAGEVANIKMDSGDDLLSSQGVIESVVQSDSNKGEVKMAKFNLDGATHEIPDAVLSHISKTEGERDRLNADCETAKTELEKAKGERDALSSENEKLKASNSDEAIAKAVQARASLESNARVILGKDANFDGMDNSAIIDQAITKHNDGKAVDGTADYKQAFFDLAVKSTKQTNSDDANNRQAVGVVTPQKEEVAFAFDSVDDDRDAMMKSFTGLED